MPDLESQMDLLFFENQDHEAIQCAQSLLRTLDPSDDDDLDIIRNILLKGFRSSCSEEFVSMLDTEGFDYTLTWPGKGGIAIVLAESGSRDSGLFFQLMKRGMVPYLPQRDGNTILHLLSGRERSPWDKEREPYVVALIRELEDITPFLETNAYGATPAHLAVLCGNTEILKAFLEKGMDPDIRGGVPASGFSHSIPFDQVMPLMLAAEMGQEEAAAALVRFGANTAAKDGKGRNACFYAVSKPNQLFCPAYYASIPSKQAVQERKCAIIRMLTDIDATDDYGRTPLLAALSLNFDAGGYGLLFLSLGADPEHADNAGRTPLIAAAAGWNKQTLKKLVDLGVDLDHQDKNGNTALHYLISEACDEKLARYLVKKGASFQLANNQGKTPIALAQESSMNDLLELML